MRSSNPLAVALAAKTADAYSMPRYGNWNAVCAMLLTRGYTSEGAEAILRSKWTRWAADESNAGYGHATSADLARFLDALPDETRAVRELVRGER